MRQVLAQYEAETIQIANADSPSSAGRSTLYLNCDEPDVREALAGRTSSELRALIGRPRLLAIDEAQRVRDIGLTLKLLVDNFPDVQVIATGSSAFELSNTISEPLTGRKAEFHLYPLSVEERLGRDGLGALDFGRGIESYLRFGSYPGVADSDDPAETIREIATSYLYRDVNLRGDLGALWENFVISERIKYQHNHRSLRPGRPEKLTSDHWSLLFLA